MPQVSLDQIPENARLTPARVQELTGWRRSTVFAWIASDVPAWALAPNPGRGPKLLKVVDANSLPTEAQKRWQESQLAGAFLLPAPAKSEALTVNSDPRQLRLLATSLPTIEQEDRVSRALAAIKIVGNGAAPSFGLTKEECVKKVAEQYGFTVKTLYRLKRAYSSEGVQGILKRKPGPAPIGAGGVYRKPENAWMAAQVLGDFRAGLSVAKCWRLVLNEIDAKQPFHPEHKYDRPTYHETKVFIASQPPINKVAREGGAAALRVAAGYCDRLIDEAAGETWCIDEWMTDGRIYLDWNMPEVVRPYIVTIIDERSEAILAWRLAVRPNAEIPVDLTEECLRKCWKPQRWYSDRGGYLRGKMGRHYNELPKVMTKAAGVLERLGILHQGPRVKNPRGNRIERPVHAFYAAKALETLAGSACGNSPEAAEALGVQARVDRHLQLCKSGDVRQTELVSYKQLRSLIPVWVAEYNSTLSHANGLHGLSRESAFRTFSPSLDVIHSRKLDETEIAVRFADRFENRVIREGGVIDLGERDGDRFRYYSPLLTVHAGRRAQVMRFRHRRSFIVAEFNDGIGDTRVLADRRTLVGIGDSEGIARAQEERARVEKYLQAQYAPAVKVRTDLPPIPPDQEITEAELVMRGGRRGLVAAARSETSEDIARRALAAELGG